MADVKKLKEILIDDLIDRIENGEQKLSEDGEVIRTPAPAQILSVAAKVAKDFAGQEEDENVIPMAKNLSSKLEKYRAANA
ncbi:hypothetical protein [Roseibium alexandrii]|uniref:Uncharacterized protein n=1 Tax=Roseibium alexandrii (strain DSM 17067 / NCIMB 14079 / DFL-11) TaxID=244592 RepID=A0A5E8GSY5_ROSAD|nr:hypothetical protein [Roseibium alexandrii]EEE42859.1 hypothetical protein SADFL11_PLAS31 [Roseibium alexandrii DFL-11]